MICKCANNWSVEPTYNEDGTTTQDFITIRNCKCRKGSEITELPQLERTPLSLEEFCDKFLQRASPDMFEDIRLIHGLDLEPVMDKIRNDEYAMYLQRFMLGIE